MSIPREAINFMAHWAPRTSCIEEKCEKLKGEWIYSGIPDKKNVILYLHGGGYIVCSPATHKNIIANISKFAGCKVFALDYSLAPENKYPTQINEALEAYLGLIEMGYSPSNISIMGDSAGGNLTLCLIDKLLRDNIPVPSSIVCLSPWCDLSSSRCSIYKNRKTDPLLPYKRITEAARMYSGAKNLASPFISPVYKTNFEGYPPTMFQVGELEILQDEMAETFRKIKTTSYNDSVYHEWKGAPHVFQLFAGLVPEAKQSLKEIGDFAKKHFQ